MTTCNIQQLLDFPGGSGVKNPPAMQETQEMMVPSLGGEDPWRRAWQATPVFLSGESHGQRSLAGYSPQGHKEQDMTELDGTHIAIINSRFLKVK